MNWQGMTWLHGKPTARGVLKASPQDFVVQEDLGWQPDGEGEHVLVRIRKVGCNTRFVADALAKFAGIASRDVSFAGLKDRHAVSEQTFCLRMPGKATPDMQAFRLEGCEVLSCHRHQRKLRTGALAGNAFRLVLRSVTDKKAVESRLRTIVREGVPNYFTSQRFGHKGNNLRQAYAWAAGEIRLRDRNKRSFLLSAARSAMFNHLVSMRLEVYRSLRSVLKGDVLQLAGRGSWFVAMPDEISTLQQRVNDNALYITAALPGSGEWGSQQQAQHFEQQQLGDENTLLALLVRERVQASRRAMLLIPGNLCWLWRDEQTLELSFWLPAGSYATAVVRELLLTDNDEPVSEE